MVTENAINRCHLVAAAFLIKDYPLYSHYHTFLCTVHKLLLGAIFGKPTFPSTLEHHYYTACVYNFGNWAGLPDRGGKVGKPIRVSDRSDKVLMAPLNFPFSIASNTPLQLIFR